MSEEPRRSGRATKGQHNKKASASPAPQAKPVKSSAKSKPPKKSIEPEPQPEDDEDEIIRCICGNTNPKDKRAFIGCDACTVWQHNVCMGVIDDEDEVPEHYFCEECRPEEHEETVQAIARGEKIWETRNKLYQAEKKMSKNRKNKSRGEDGRPAWLKKDIPPAPPAAPPATAPVEPKSEPEPEPVQPPEPEPELKAAKEPSPAPAATAAATASPVPAENGTQESNNKRKRDVKEEQEAQPAPEKKTLGRQEKRRKSSTIDSKVTPDADTALVSMTQLPKDRQSVAQALSKIIVADVQHRIKGGFSLPDGQTPPGVGEYHALRIEYALHINHGAGVPAYKQQFMAINANLKKNKVLIERLLNGSLTADELSTMSSIDMASEEQQRERAALKEALDRQTIAVVEEGPKYRQDHKGIHLIENSESEPQAQHPPPPPPPPAFSPPQETTEASRDSPEKNQHTPLTVNTNKDNSSELERPSSSQVQQFDMKNIWARTSAQSPTDPRRMSSVQATPVQQNGGATVDPDVDRMLEDDDEPYSPADASGQDTIVWRGKLVQTSETESPTVNARFVAGRDLTPTVPWQSLLPSQLSIDGRLAIRKAEEYLCGLKFSSSSDVSVLALTPYDNAEAFNVVFEYFRSRERYAVIEKDKPKMVKDVYIIPVEVGDALPDHITMLEHCTLKSPAEERALLATFVVARAPSDINGTPQLVTNDSQFPRHVRQSIGGPAGSPLNAQTPFPPNPYGPQVHPQPHPNPEVNRILGDLQYTESAKTILQADPNLSSDKLVNLKKIFTDHPHTQVNFQAFTEILGGV